MLTDDLDWFVVLAETCQVTETAHRTHLSQPTLSRKLARLERQMGAPLFDRNGRRLTLNPNGEILHAHAVAALRELREAQDRINLRSDPDGGTVRLDFLHSFGTWLVPHLLRGYRLEHPRTHFELHQASAQTLIDRVAGGAADLAVVSPRPRSSQLSWAPIAHQSLALAVPTGHRFAGLPRIDLADAADEPFIGMHADFGMRRILDELCAAAGFTPTLVFESSELATVGGLVSASLGVSVMPVQNPPIWAEGVTYVPIDGAERKIGLIWPKTRPLAAPARSFRAYAEETTWS